MTESVDDWPKYPNFYPGPAECLHAIGVISSCYNSFERILFDIYMHHLRRQGFPERLCEFYYLGLPEDRRPDAVKQVFDTFEKNAKVKDRVENLLKYFRWCWQVRNVVLHGEAYPTLIVDKTDLMLVKRKRRSAEREYHALPFAKLRDLADKIEAGRTQAAKINLHLRYRSTPRKRLSAELTWIMHNGEELRDGCGKRRAIHVASRCLSELRFGSALRHSRHERRYAASLRASICPA